VELDNGVSLDFANAEGPIGPQHYAFLISEADFDAVLGRIRERGLDHWADPARHRPGEINHIGGGRGVYFPDPDGHQLGVITGPYGSGGSWARRAATPEISPTRTPWHRQRCLNRPERPAAQRPEAWWSRAC